ncbi:hypothetical protein [Brevundimonas nasdae]|uniref:Uncharacterized protein n=1 Tax=Brevundimonas nasdae TaxID=172043 RepID=A0ABX8TJI2_9CAUL|nr:hypothetical protein [Brevundimonas nasdae]QYC09314.1 hypothetical protein KWG56_11920 [Brevundimonas nasdae]
MSQKGQLRPFAERSKTMAVPDWGCVKAGGHSGEGGGRQVELRQFGAFHFCFKMMVNVVVSRLIRNVPQGAKLLAGDLLGWANWVVLCS